ncbi:MAG: T9SS type A sorting domain-containing protein [Ignavibacteria bacterium]|nr:T9SS type A sorting domain-containing protein [Ignavibacteria bacterium]
MKTIIITLLILLLFSLNSVTANNITLENLKTLNGISGSNDYARDVKLSQDGFLYTCGYSSDGISSFATISKNTQSGERIWVKTYRRSTNGFDYYNKILIDNTNNIYVLGATWDSIKKQDISIHKYSSDGLLIWTKEFNGTSNGNDEPIDFIFDDINNLILTGVFVNQNSKIGIYKINSSGLVLWEYTYENSSPDNYFVKDIEKDYLGNIYIAAVKNSNVSGIILKLNSSGSLISTNSSTQFPGITKTGSYSIAIDSLNNIFLSSQGRNDNFQSNLNLIEKLNNNLEFQWGKLVNPYYPGNMVPFSIQFDKNRDLVALSIWQPIITENKDFSPMGIFISKFSIQGDSLWRILIPSNGISDNPVLSLKISNDNNYKLLFKRSYGVKSFNGITNISSSGDTTLITNIYPELNGIAEALEIDNSGNYFIGAGLNKPSNGLDKFLIKYNQEGQLQWNDKYNSEGFSHDIGGKIIEDYKGNIYVSGANNRQTIILKYSPLLNQIWENTLNLPPESAIEFSPLLIVDGFNNLISVSSIYNDNTGRDILIRKFTENGNIVDSIIYSSEGSYIDIPKDITLDNNNNLYISCTKNNNQTLQASSIVKFDNNLNFQWVSNDIGNESHYYQKVKINNGYLFYTGNNVVQKLNLNGGLVWRKKFQPNNFVNYFTDFAIDSLSGDIIAVGSGGYLDQSYNYIICRYTQNGDSIYTIYYNGGRNREDIATSVVIEKGGNFFVTGSAKENPSNFQMSITTLKFNLAGQLLWKKNFSNTENNGNISPGKMIIDEYNNIYITSENSYYYSIGYSYLILKYKPNGEFVWKSNFDNGRIRNVSTDFVLTKNKELVITGNAYGQNTSYDITTVRYSQTSNILTNSENIPDDFQLYQNYPNPFNNSTNIKFSIPINSSIKLKLYDLSGRLISILINKELLAGNHIYRFDGEKLSSGIYFIKLESNNFSSIRKIVMIK